MNRRSNRFPQSPGQYGSGSTGGGRRGTTGALGRHTRAAAVLAAFLLVTLLVTLLLNRSGLPDLTQERMEEQVQGLPTPAFCGRERPPLICAHGGDTRQLPPNTMQAFQAAVDMGADCVEVDAALTSDGVLVVLHIRELEQLMGKGYQPGLQVGDMTWATLQLLSWPGGQRVMRVREAVLQTSPFVDCVTLDVKTHQDSSGQPTDEDMLVEVLTQLVHETGCHNCLVWAKSDKIVAGVNTLSPGQRTGYILMNQTTEARQEGMAEPLRMQAPEVVGAYYGMVDRELVQLLHRHNKKIYVWTVNDPVVMRNMLDAGVDALVTNQPLLAQQAIDWRMARCGGVGAGGSSAWPPPAPARV